MTRESRPWITPDSWANRRQFTDARIALGRSGQALPTAPMLDFQAAHAQARDAVNRELQIDALRDAVSVSGLPCVVVKSRAENRLHYLQRPDLGRRLSDASVHALAEHAGQTTSRPDLQIVLADGLSAQATMTHAAPICERLIRSLPGLGLTTATIVIAQQARVALGDEVGELLHARQVLILLGERPGLSSPISLSAYLTFNPKVGTQDAHRNCVSNIRPDGGLSYDAAAHTLLYLIDAAQKRQLTGVALKDHSANAPSLLTARSDPPR